ncbi:MAG: hypothetical protein ACOC0N_06500 [Chroococcales cyanobacterium]
MLTNFLKHLTLSVMTIVTLLLLPISLGRSQDNETLNPVYQQVIDQYPQDLAKAKESGNLTAEVGVLQGFAALILEDMSVVYFLSNKFPDTSKISEARGLEQLGYLLWRNEQLEEAQTHLNQSLAHYDTERHQLLSTRNLHGFSQSDLNLYISNSQEF